jgi:transposase
MALTLTTDERAELERRVRSLKIRAEDARRARVILLLADGESYSTIEASVPCYRDYINRWRRRFLADRLEGLRPRYRGQPPTVLTPAMEARVLAQTQHPPPDGSTHWSTRKLRRLLKIHHNLVAKAWQRAGLPGAPAFARLRRASARQALRRASRGELRTENFELQTRQVGTGLRPERRSEGRPL